MSARVLFVEDDPSIRRSMRITLKTMNFEVTEAATGEDALVCAEAQSFDAVLLDLNMPGMGGLETCRRLRAMHPRLPILIVSVRNAEQDMVRLLDSGADDYITKPFSVKELAARLRAALRRNVTPESEEDEVVRVGMFELHLQRRIFTRGGKRIALTPTEFDLLRELMQHAGHPVAHTQLLHRVWGAEYGQEREYLRTYILQLRRKVEDDPANPAYILTDSHFGYRFESGETDK